VNKIVVINPNSSESVTRDIDAALDPLRAAGRPDVACVTLHDGPPAIESDDDVADAAGRICRYVRRRGEECGAFVIACFSDPGLQEARAACKTPIIGIGESSILASLAIGSRTGVISILESSFDRHMRLYRSLGVEKRIVGELSVETGVAGLSSEDDAFRRLADAGRRLRDECGADVIVLACAGMARYRAKLQDRLELPVIDPTQAATGLALTLLQVRIAGNLNSNELG